MKNKKLEKGVYNWTFFFIVLGVVILVNIIGAFAYKRFDVTSDKRYSLNEGTIKYLKDETNFADRISMRIYLDGKLPAEVQRFKNAIEDKLKEFKQYAGTRIEYTFIDPLKGSEEDVQYVQEQLYNKGKGIIPTGLAYMKDGTQSEMYLWPGIEIDYGGSITNTVQLLPGTPQGKFYTLNEAFNQVLQNSINNLEYMLISGIRRATQQTKKRVAFLQGHGELSAAETQRVRALISPYYSVQDITLNDSIDALKGVTGLVIARPLKTFSDKDKYLIDQFVMNGGRLMCFFDKLSFSEDSLMRNGIAHTDRTNLDLDRMLFDYGIKVNDNYVTDVRCAPKLVATSKQGFIHWFFYVRATPTMHPIARNIAPVILRYASEVQFVGNSGNVSTPILTSSTNSAMTGLAPLLSLAMPANYGENPILAPDPSDENNKLCLAGIVEGSFTSHFKNRIVTAYTENKEANFKEASVKEGKVLVVGNGSFIKNAYDSVPNQFGTGYNYIPRPFNELKMDETVAMLPGNSSLYYGNQEFFQNIVDYMMDDNSVLDLRSKQIEIRELDKAKVKNESGFYKMINMVVPSVIIIIIALMILMIRKKKYTRK